MTRRVLYGASATWSISEPVFRAGETYTIPRDISEAEAIAIDMGIVTRLLLQAMTPIYLGTYHLVTTRQAGRIVQHIEIRFEFKHGQQSS
jgi:hypothetical protein